MLFLHMENEKKKEKIGRNRIDNITGGGYTK